MKELLDPHEAIRKLRARVGEGRLLHRRVLHVASGQEGDRGSVGSAMRIAVFTDVHGNLPALEAALAVIERARCDAIYHTGDQRLAHNQNEQLSPTLGTVSGHSAAALGHIGREILAKHIGRRGAAVRKEMLVKVCAPRKRGPRAVAGGVLVVGGLA